jgi:imidazolonepropionase
MSSRKKTSLPRSRAKRAAASLLFVNAAQVVTCAGSSAARRGADMNVLQVLRDAAVATRGDTIVAVGERKELQRRFRTAARVDCAGGVLLPALVDSHTHGVFGVPRAAEHEMRAAGVDYMEIARRGGGIHQSLIHN